MQTARAKHLRSKPVNHPLLLTPLNCFQANLSISAPGLGAYLLKTATSVCHCRLQSGPGFKCERLEQREVILGPSC